MMKNEAERALEKIFEKARKEGFQFDSHVFQAARYVQILFDRATDAQRLVIYEAMIGQDFGDVTDQEKIDCIKKIGKKATEIYSLLSIMLAQGVIRLAEPEETGMKFRRIQYKDGKPVFVDEQEEGEP